MGENGPEDALRLSDEGIASQWDSLVVTEKSGKPGV